MARPGAVSIALSMLWFGLGLAGFEALVAAADRFGMLPFSGGLRVVWGIGDMLGLLGILFQAICIISVTRGYGLIRLPLFIGIGWMLSRMVFSGIFREPGTLAPYHLLAPLGYAVRAVAVGLLLLPRSNAWFLNMHRRRHGSAEPTASAWDEIEMAADHSRQP